MATLVFFLLVFLIVSIVFLFIHLMMGKFIRPANPESDKLTIYECGEPTIGTSWIQFDVRYYVIALLFVIFDVEVAFFFPWAVTYGKACDLARLDPRSGRDAGEKNEIIAQQMALTKQVRPAALPLTGNRQAPIFPLNQEPISNQEASYFAWTAMVDILVFFGVLLVGFAYLWKRGDIDWVKTVAAERAAEPVEPAPYLPKPSAAGAFAGAGQH